MQNQADLSAKAPLDLSVCVIGRNEANNLPKLVASLAGLGRTGLSFETLYVDSASSDASVDVARELFDAVYLLEDNINLSASAGRSVGVLHARGRWILFLDGDMELEDAAPDWIAEHVRHRSEKVGATGRYRNIYPQGDESDKPIRGNVEGAVCRHFGGAVLLSRSLLLEAGNWDPRLFSNEEAELYTRLKDTGGVVLYRDKPFIRHNTPKISRMKMLAYSALPIKGGLGKKYYGIGQVIAARFYEKKLLSLFYRMKEPFIYVFLVMLSLIYIMFSGYFAAYLIFVLAFAYITIVRGMTYAVLYLCWVPQMVLGWHKLDRNYVPVVRASWSKTGGAGIQAVPIK